MIKELTIYNAEASTLIEGEILEDGYLCNVIKVTDLNDTLKSVRDELTEAENKALRFVEWIASEEFIYSGENLKGEHVWWNLKDEKVYKTAELFASPEFLIYLNK